MAETGTFQTAPFPTLKHRRWRPVLLMTVVLCGLGGFVVAAPEAKPNSLAEFPAPRQSTTDFYTHIFSIPAPRGAVSDRTGEILAHSVVAHRCALRLLGFENPDDVESIIVQAQSLACELQSVYPAVQVPAADEIRQHWEHRRWIPIPITDVLTKDQENLLEEFANIPQLVKEAVYTRVYHHGSPVSHLIGYVSRDRPDQHGPMAASEHLWSPFDGQMGMEKALNEVLSGKDGKVSLLYDADGHLTSRVMAETPQPGHTVVTTINLAMQELAMRVLKESGRPGAIAAVDARTGDILAVASYPTFDPNAFVPPNSPVDFYGEDWDNLPDAPFFSRAIDGSYPPGSAFKPLVALAALDTQTVKGTLTRYPGPPSLDVDGRVFRNWNGSHEGRLDVRFAILRSCNTWFYQVAIDTGSEAVLQAARNFGLGAIPPIPLPLSYRAAGNVPKGYLVNRAIANLSIGQGELLVSPLQMAMAMAGLANGEYVPQLRLVLHTQDAATGEVIEQFPPTRFKTLPYSPRDIELVRDGMWGVVNHPAGTGERAALRYPGVYGKTGTSQWYANGKERRLAWFTGFVKTKNPQIAFAVLSQGKVGESLSGGRNAAPLARQFIGAIYANPSKYHIERTPKSRWNDSLNDTRYLSTPRTMASREQEERKQANEALSPDQGTRNVVAETQARPERPVIRARIIQPNRVRTRR